jgi:hypothetical protein
MRSPCRSVGVYVLTVVAAVAFSGAPDASAQGKKKMTYAQAFAACKKDVDASTPGEQAASHQRFTRGASCMRGYGFTLKKGTKI